MSGIYPISFLPFIYFSELLSVTVGIDWVASRSRIPVTTRNIICVRGWVYFPLSMGERSIPSKSFFSRHPDTNTVSNPSQFGTLAGTMIYFFFFSINESRTYKRVKKSSRTQLGMIFDDFSTTQHVDLKF